MPLEGILVLFTDMHARGMYASAEAYCLAFNRLADEVRAMRLIKVVKLSPQGLQNSHEILFLTPASS